MCNAVDAYSERAFEVYCNLNALHFSGIISVLRQLPPRKIAPNLKTNPNPTPNPNWGVIFLGGNCLVAPHP